MPRHLPTTVEKTIQKAHRQSHQIQQIALCSTPKQRIETIAEKISEPILDAGPLCRK